MSTLGFFCIYLFIFIFGCVRSFFSCIQGVLLPTCGVQVSCYGGFFLSPMLVNIFLTTRPFLKYNSLNILTWTFLPAPDSSLSVDRTKLTILPQIIYLDKCSYEPSSDQSISLEVKYRQTDFFKIIDLSLQHWVVCMVHGDKTS